MYYTTCMYTDYNDWMIYYNMRPFLIRDLCSGRAFREKSLRHEQFTIDKVDDVVSTSVSVHCCCCGSRHSWPMYSNRIKVLLTPLEGRISRGCLKGPGSAAPRSALTATLLTWWRYWQPSITTRGFCPWYLAAPLCLCGVLPALSPLISLRPPHH